MRERTITVHVRRDHIDSGIRGSATQCPLAIALREQADLPEVYVEEDHWDRGLNTEAPLTARAQTFIRRFDAGEPVTPQRFRLAWPVYRVAG